ncbi:Ankyrin repeat domain-containing protein 26 [Heterocephalus glaber]|uniref:Ankyrin repeat domain-containing protein 26 n=1 Tax=Heterocephalus glaber TaxID=10181 RepID=G5AY77_HETGA|nr:Ankyrin repeat domain-containing protein 26 [Heterocephalus glaber]
MRRVFGLSSRGQAPSGPAGQQGSCRGPWPGVRVRAVGKLHKAASAGDAARVQHLLILGKSGVNDRDEKHRFSDKPDPDDSWPTSEEDDFNFDNKNVPKINLTELWAAAQQSRKNQAKYSTGEPGNRTLLDSISDSENKDVVETLPKTSVNVQSFSQSSFLSPSPEPKEEATRSAIRKEENGTCVIKNDSQEQTNENLTHVDGGHKNYKSDMMFALGLGEDDESPWDSESVSENLPQKSVDHLSGAADEKGKHTGNRQVEESPEKCLHLKVITLYLHLELTTYFMKYIVFIKYLTSNPIQPAIEMKDSVPNKAVAVEDLQTCKSEEPEEEQKRLHGCENSQEQVKEQIDGVDDLDDLSQPSETASEDFELLYPKYENILLLFEQLRMECKEMFKLFIKYLIVNKFALQQEEEKRRNVDQFYEKIKEQLRKKEEQYYQEVEAKQQLEISLRTLDIELKTVRNKLNQVLEEQNDTLSQLSPEQNCRMLPDGILANRFCEQKEIEMAPEKMSPEVSISHEEDMLHKNHRLQDEITRLRLEIDAIKNQNQVKEKKYLGDIEIANEKNDDLQRTIKLNEETIFQSNGQLNSLTIENTMLNSKLENEKRIKERLETEIESYRSRLAAAVHNYDESQTSKRDVELAFQRARDEWVRLQDKLNFDISNLKDNNEMLSQQLSKAERKFNSLEIELHHTRDALREKTSVLEQVQRDLKQTQCQMKEIKHMYQDEQGKVNKYMGKQESIEERLSQLQSENALLRQQLDDAHNKVDYKERTLINIQDQFHDIVKTLQGESKKQSLMLEDRNKELINECNHLKERVYQYENEKAEKEVVVRQLEQELADTLKKQSMSEASLEISSHYRINLEDETRDLKKKLSQIRSQLEEEQNRHTEAAQCAEKMQEYLQKLELENSRLKVKIKKQAGKTEQLQKNLLSANLSEDKEQLKKLSELTESLEFTLHQEKKKNGELQKELTGFKKLFKMTKTKLNEQENGDFYFHGDLKSSELDIPINMLIHKVDDLAAKLETASSKCLHLDKNDLLQQELLSMKNIQKKCETLEKKEKKLEEEVVNLRSHMEKNVLEHGQAEQYKQEIEERARRDLVEKLKQVNLFLQTQAASQENLQQLRETNNASMRSQMELRIKDLESEVSKMKTQEESNKIQLEKYRQCYLEEFNTRKSLSSKLNKANERLEEANTKLLVEQQQNRSLLSTVSTRPVLECPCVGNLNHSLVFQRSFLPRENLVVPPLNLQPSNTSIIESYLTKMRQELEKSITREVREATVELESGSFKVSPTRSANKSSQDLISETSQEYLEILRRRYMI